MGYAIFIPLYIHDWKADPIFPYRHQTPAEERATWALNPLRTLHLRNGDTTSITALRFHG
jgi:hypothetical protein